MTMERTAAEILSEMKRVPQGSPDWERLHEAWDCRKWIDLSAAEQTAQLQAIENEAVVYAGLR